MNDEPADALGRAVDDFFERVDSGESANPFAFEESLGDGFPDFLRAVEAKGMLESLLEPPRPADPPRSLGPYVVGRRLGRGGGGAVYEARDTRSNDRVALKLLHAALSDHATHVDRFEREARIGARIRHPHLVDIRETGSIDGRLFCAMRLVDGPTLRERLREGPLPVDREVLEQFAGIADGLATLHEQGVLHRDVKPSNILIDGSGRFLLGDFGLVRPALESTITGSGDAVGTLGYMSPEQLRGGAVDGRTDVFALGATLFEAFCGRRAHEGGSISAILEAARAEAPPDPRAIRPELPDELAHVIRTALERRREDRYPDVALLRDDLRRLAAGQRDVRQPVPAARRWLRRHRRALVAGAALLLAAAATGAWLANRPGVCTVDSHPSSAVWIDGVYRGETPITLELAPGSYEGELRRERFAPRPFRLVVRAGGDLDRGYTLTPRDANDVDAFSALVESLGRRLARFVLPASRGPGDAPPGRALFPADRCRPSDLVAFRFESSPDHPFPAPATFFVRRGGTSLLEQELPVVDLVVERPFPGELRDRLAAGDEVTWGVRAATGEEYAARFTVAADDAADTAVRARLEARMRDAPAAVAAYLRGELLLEQGLACAALLQALAADGDHPLVLGARVRALEALGALDSRLGQEVGRAALALEPEAREAWFR